MKFRNNASEVDAEIAAFQHSLKMKQAPFKPETSGVSLEQIEENIRKGLPLKKLGK